MALELRDSPRAIAPNAGQPQDVSFVQSAADEHGDESHQGQVFLAHVLRRRWARQPERDVDAFEHRERNADLLTQLGEGPIGTRRPSAPDLDVAEGKIPRGERIRDSVCVDAHRIKTADESCSQHVPPRIGPVIFGLEDAQLAEQRDVFRSRPRTLRDLFRGEPIQGHARA